jgi:hypothetical protein
MFVLFVSRMHKVFVVREATGPTAYDPPEESYPDVSLVDDSIQGKHDAVAEALRIAKEEGWREFHLSFS